MTDAVKIEQVAVNVVLANMSRSTARTVEMLWERGIMRDRPWVIRARRDIYTACQGIAAQRRRGAE